MPVPSEAQSLVTLLLPEFATQMLAPSKAMPTGPVPTVLAPRGAPSEARSLVTLLLPQSATQMLAPSKAMPYGDWPTGNLIPDRFAPYQRNWAMDSGLLGVPVGQIGR